MTGSDGMCHACVENAALPEDMLCGACRAEFHDALSRVRVLYGGQSDAEERLQAAENGEERAELMDDINRRAEQIRQLHHQIAFYAKARRGT